MPSHQRSHKSEATEDTCCSDLGYKQISQTVQRSSRMRTVSSQQWDHAPCGAWDVTLGHDQGTGDVELHRQALAQLISHKSPRARSMHEDMGIDERIDLLWQISCTNL